MNKTLTLLIVLLWYSPLSFAMASADFEDEDSMTYAALEHEDVADDDGEYMILAQNTQPGMPNEYYVDHPRYASNQSHRRGSSTPREPYDMRLPQRISGYGEKVIMINPRKHVWGAYSSDGQLLRAGLATAGSSWCPDIGRSCRTKSGSFRINSLGSRGCYSHKFPVGRGGAPMPYCMFFNGGQGLHGSYELAEANLSHGCVRISVNDAEWVRFNFATVGTRVVVLSY